MDNIIKFPLDKINIHVYNSFVANWPGSSVGQNASLSR